MSSAVIQDISPAEPPKLEPIVIELGEFEASYDEKIAAKLAENADPRRIAWNTGLATDKNFPDARIGRKRYRASAVRFGKPMSDEELEGWCKENKKISATPKEGIDLAMVSPRPKLDNAMPLAMAGQFFVGADRRRQALCLYHGGDVRRNLVSVLLFPDEQWLGHWFFLVLEELPSAA